MREARYEGGAVTLDTETLRAWSKRLRGAAKDLQKAADNQYDCCHGDDATEELESASLLCDTIAKEIDQMDVDQLRIQLRSP